MIQDCKYGVRFTPFNDVTACSLCKTISFDRNTGEPGMWKAQLATFWGPIPLGPHQEFTLMT